MTHAIEANVSNMSNRICDAQALQALRLITENLPLVGADGEKGKTRLKSQIGTTPAGGAVNVAPEWTAAGESH